MWTGERARARSARHQQRDPLHGRRERRVHRSCAGLHRRARAHRQRREGRCERRRHQGADRQRHADRARTTETPVSAFVALQEAGDLPQHAAMVHRDGPRHPRRQRQSQARRHPAPSRADGDRRDQMGPAAGREPHQRHDREPARLGDLAPARLGCADRGVRTREGRRLGRDPAGRAGQQAHRRGLRGRRRGRLVCGRRARALPRQPRQRGLAEGRRHSRCLVRLRLDARLHAGGPAAFPEPCGHQAQDAGRRRYRDVSGGLRPASRLVSFFAARELRNARRRAVRRGPDPRLRARRARAQDVEVARQHGRAAGRDEAVGRRHPAHVGVRLGLRRRHPHRPGDHQDHRRHLPQAAQHAALDARQSRAFPFRGPRVQSTGCPSWSG